MKILRILMALVIFMTGVTLGYLSGKPSEEYIANHDTLPYKIEVIQAQEEYFNACEALLDSIYNATDWSTSTFTDVVMETDTYYDYEVARGRVEFLNNMEDNAELSWDGYREYLKQYNLEPYQTNLED